jgi:hypothetical protein
MTTDPIEVMANFIRDEGGFTSAPKPFAVKMSDHLTAQGYIIMTTAERDGIKAAMAAEAAEMIKRYIIGYGGDDPSLRPRPDGEISNLLYADAILALATAPAGFVCVPVERTQGLLEGIVFTEFGGNCPVQATGTIDGRNFYFRARGARWSIGVGGDSVGAPTWRYEEPYGEGPFDAGWMDTEIAKQMINKGATLYRAMTASHKEG